MKLNKRNRITALILALVLAVMAFPFTAFADVDVDDGYDYERFKGQKISINVYNWGEYISDGSEEDTMNVNKEFEKLTGIHVNYTTFASNEELYAKLKSGGSSYDIIIPSDYMISRMAEEGMLEELDFANIPNFSYIDEDFVKPMYDPENKFSVPYTWGIVGIIYNKTRVDPDDDLASWDILWNPKYALDILMFSNSRDAMGISLKRLGYSFNTTDEKQLREAADELKKQKELVQAYVMDEIFDKMGGGEAALAPYYAGDAVTMMAENPDLGFVVPKEGTNRFVDAICIPKGAKNKEAAEMYINFLCETEVALANCEYIGYSTPHTGAFEELDEEMRESVSYPSAEILANTEYFVNLPAATNKLVDSLWTEILSSNSEANQWIMPVFLLLCVGLSLGITIHRKVKKRRGEY